MDCALIGRRWCTKNRLEARDSREGRDEGGAHGKDLAGLDTLLTGVNVAGARIVTLCEHTYLPQGCDNSLEL